MKTIPYPTTQTLGGTKVHKAFVVQADYIFSRLWDPLIFIGVSLGALLVPFVFPVNALFRDMLLTYLIYDALLSYGHSFGGFYPVVFSLQNRVLKLSHYLGLSALCLLFGVGLYNFSPELFLGVIGLSLMWHHTRQKVGWIQHLNKKSPAAAGGSLWDQAITYHVCLVPLLYHLTDSSQPQKTMYIFGDLSFVALPSTVPLPGGGELSLTAFALTLFGLGVALYLFKEVKNLLKTRRLYPGKYYVILSGLLCFALPYMLWPHRFQFFIPNVIVHTVSYIGFTYIFSKNHKITALNPHKTSFVFLKNFFFYLLLIMGWGLVLLGITLYGLYSTSFFGKNIVYPLVFSVFFIHYLTDAFVWKKKFMQAPCPGR